MKMRYKAICAALAALLLAGCASTGTRRKPRLSGDFEYSIYEYEGKKFASIVKYHGNETDIIIPDIINGLPVTSIHDSAMASKGLTSVRIPEGIKFINTNAFSDNQLTSITIPESVETIDYGAFSDNQLTSITISPGITFLDGFQNNQLTSITIPPGVRSLGGFAGNQLTSITIPSSVIEIRNAAFADNQITSVTIPDSVKTIGGQAFTNNPLISITIPENVRTIEGTAFIDNKLNFYLVSNDANARSGQYEKRDNTWYHNGTVLILKATLVCQREGYNTIDDGEGVFITRIDGVPGFSRIGTTSADMNWRYYRSKEIYLDEGFHSIEVAYYRQTSTRSNPNSTSVTTHTTYTKDGAEFEHALVLEGGIYDLTATEEGGKIQFQIKKRP